MLPAVSQQNAVEENPILSNEDFLKLREHFYRKTGIFFEDSKRYFVDKRVLDRMKATHHDSFRSYFVYLRFEESQAEMEGLINSLTVNETYFYREDYQFHCLVKNILPEIIARSKHNKQIRIWSILCATGEEPYSLALFLLENWPQVDSYDVEILASDIDTSVLTAARAGRYGARALQYLPPGVVQKYFTKLDNDTWQLCEAIRSSVSFRQTNIMETPSTRQHLEIDVIFCRNLLIYFDELSRRKAAENLFASLRSGGFICLGHAESMSRISSLFAIRKFPEAIVYQKVEE